MFVTKRRVLEDLLEQLAEEKRRMSQNRAGRVAQYGWEIPFQDTEKKMQLVREMIQGLEAVQEFDELQHFAKKNQKALKNSAVRDRIRRWQEEIMAGEGPNMNDLRLDRGEEDAHHL